MKADVPFPVLAAGPWDWVMDHFGFAPAYRGALFLLAGGLFIAGLITFTLLTVHLVMPGNGNPDAVLYRPRAETLVDPRRHRLTPRQATVPVVGSGDPAAAFLRGRMAGRAGDPESLDDILEKAIQGNLGEPRILRSGHSRKHLRFYACGTCETLVRLRPEDRWRISGTCEYERGYLTGSFETLLGTRVEVREVQCRRRGGTYCEFDVAYGPKSSEPAPAEQRKTP